MNSNEKLLFKELCKFKNPTFDEELLKYATPNVLGKIFFNRMQGVAYDVLKRNNLLGKVNREFRNSLQIAYEHNVKKNDSFFQCLEYLSNILNGCTCKVAMLKGAYLCAHYPMGYRTSNDIDLLVLPKDVTTIGNLLLAEGFKQGSVRDGVFVPSTRKEIIESKMTRGETVPYIKEINLPEMRFLEVDINFSLDYKNGNDTLLETILNRIVIVEQQNVNIITLDKYDFFIHLCSHLYKEATTLPWVEMHRDMTLYKYCDIYMLLLEMAEKDINALFLRSKELNMEKVCVYAIFNTIKLFDINNIDLIDKVDGVLKKYSSLILTVVSPKDKKKFNYKTSDVVERFFMTNRLQDLYEVNDYENT